MFFLLPIAIAPDIVRPFLRTVQRVSSGSVHKNPLTYDELAISYALCLPRYLNPLPPRWTPFHTPRAENVRQYEELI